jgi:hypothetical protein
MPGKLSTVSTGRAVEKWAEKSGHLIFHKKSAHPEQKIRAVEFPKAEIQAA